MQIKPKYNDIKFFLISIAFISAYNYYLTYSNIKFNWFLIITYSIDTIEGWLAWWVVRSIIIYLDKKIPYINYPIRRIALQILTTTISGLLVIIILTEMVSWIAKGRPALLNFYTFDIFIFIIWFLVINAIYIGIYYYQEWKKSDYYRQEEKKVRLSGFTLTYGKQNILIPFNEIIGFYTEGGCTILLNWQNKKYILDKSLNKVENSLPKEQFFRLNRQYLLHRNIITGFKKSDNGKIEILLTLIEKLPTKIRVSREKAADFKKWFHS